MVIGLSEINQNLSRKYNVFIASASYEGRSLSIMKELLQKTDFDYKIVSLSIPHKALIENNLKEFLENGFESLEVDNSNQLMSVDNIGEYIFKVLSEKPTASFLIDITAFTRQTLLLLLRLLRNLLSKKNHVDFIYMSAKEYAVGLKEEEKWLTKGILEVNSVFGYSGIIRPSRMYHLIILLGYEVERASSLIAEYEPSKISIGYPDKWSSITEEHYDLNMKRFQESIKTEYPTADSFEFSCTDIDQCKRDILRQVKIHRDHNIIISPMNNKISTVATSMVAFEDEEVQIAIAVPALYNTENYSTVGDKVYYFNIDNFLKN